jgi:hypothetical protein
MKVFLPHVLAVFIFCLTAGWASNATAQGFLNHWHFGDGNGINFTSGEPVGTPSGSSLLNARVPVSYADADGNLKFYCDHQRVYNANHVVMDNGQFGIFSVDATVIPHPSNPNQVYLIRSLGNSGLEYSIIDLTLSDGLGSIVEGQKEINFASLGGQLMVAQKPDGSGHWLVTSDNNNSSDIVYIRTFDVGESGITTHNIFTFSWFWVGWNAQLDDARISPNCELIAVAFKGHYIGLIRYDAEIGNATEALQNSVDNFTSFGSETRLCFSPNNQFLYTKGDDFEVKQMDVSSFNSQTINASLTTISVGFSSGYKDIQLGPDGRVYVLNASTQSLDAILSPDLQGTACQFTPQYFALPSATEDRLPNSPNLFCGEAFLLIPQVVDVCLGETTTFSLTTNQSVDAISWDFGDGNGSEALNPTHLYETSGTYNVTVEVDINGEMFLFDLVANVNAFPNGALDPFYEVCAGELFALSPGAAESYAWNTGATSAELSVTTSGAYTVEMANGACSIFLATEVEVIQAPSFTVGNDQVLCDEVSTTVSASTPVQWSTGATASEISVTVSGVYTASLSNTCFTTTESVAVQFVTVPNPTLPPMSTICTGDEITLNFGFDADQVVWTGNGVSNDSGGLIVNESGTYTVNGLYQGCPFSDEAEVEVLDFVDVSLVVMPNIFSPNSDAVNNVFRPFLSFDPTRDLCSLAIIDVNMSIYNRWGGLIVENACSWDGDTDGGQALAEGVYYYIVDMNSTCNGQGGGRRITGDLTLTR